ncbi:MAG: Sua5/YciO/YrdC/YwlC family protein, partial [Acidobacteria bacterium]|nr:Sua5/YciO/YrdC/YwlC family protein [Acidobacteriota bacterium]
MATDLIELDAEEPSKEAIERAAAAVLRGRVVAIPTEARYALVADPFNLRAVSRVYAAKGREEGRSLPVLVSDLMMAEELTAEVSARLRILARHYWPGPLTIIVPAAAKIPLKVTGNSGRLGLRQSRSKVAAAL